MAASSVSLPPLSADRRRRSRASDPRETGCAAISISKSRSPTCRARSRNCARSATEGDAVAIGEEIARLEAKAAQALAEIYAKLTPWQKTQVARHPDRPHFSDYVERADRGVHAAGRRPQVRRGRGDRRRPRPLPRPAGRGDRPREGQRHRKPAQAQFRHGAAGRLPQGGARHGTGRPLRPAGGLAGRHRRRLSRHRRRGARPGRGDRPLDRSLPQARRAERRRGHRRGRLGRRHRHRHRQQGADAGARDLHGDLAGRRGLDPVARFQPRAGCRDRHEDHRRGPA